MSRDHSDVAIAGAGPAGTAAAILLSRAGARVTLVGAGTPGALQGASPRVAALLARLGLAAEGMALAVARQVRWGELPGATNREHPLDRARFDAGLAAQAADEGVRVLQGTVARLDPGRGELTLRDGRVVGARRLVEARGRRAAGASGRVRGPATVAIVAPGASGGAASAIEARPGGWIWRLGHPGAGGVTQVVTGPAGPGAEGLARAWAAVTGEPLPEGARACGAEMRLTAPELDAGCLRVGDAAIAIDPLSGHGLFWALSSALMLPPILAALDAGGADLARRFWRERVAATFWRQARIGRDFHAMAGFATPFWAARRAWPDAAPAHAEVVAPRLARQVVVADGRLAEAEVVVTANAPEGAAFLAGRPLVPLLREFMSRPLPGPDALAAHLPGRRADEVRAAHDWLAAAGLPDATLFRDPHRSRPHHSRLEATP